MNRDETFVRRCLPQSGRHVERCTEKNQCPIKVTVRWPHKNVPNKRSRSFFGDFFVWDTFLLPPTAACLIIITELVVFVCWLKKYCGWSEGPLFDRTLTLDHCCTYELLILIFLVYFILAVWLLFHEWFFREIVYNINVFWANNKNIDQAVSSPWSEKTITLTRKDCTGKT